MRCVPTDGVPRRRLRCAHGLLRVACCKVSRVVAHAVKAPGLDARGFAALRHASAGNRQHTVRLATKRATCNSPPPRTAPGPVGPPVCRASHAERCIAQRARRKPPCAVHRATNRSALPAASHWERTDERLRVELNSLVASSAYCRMAPSRVATSDEVEVEPANTNPA